MSPQRAALMALYESAGGDGWSGKGGWMTDSFECSWPGVKCEGGVVVELDLGKFNIDGYRFLLVPRIVQVCTVRTA